MNAFSFFKFVLLTYTFDNFSWPTRITTFLLIISNDINLPNLGLVVIICNTLYALLSYFIEYPLWFDIVYIVGLFCTLFGMFTLGKEDGKV